MNKREIEDYKLTVDILLESNRLLTSENNTLQEKLNMAIYFLDRLSHWDMLWTGEGVRSLVADGPYWKEQIDNTLEKLRK